MNQQEKRGETLTGQTQETSTSPRANTLPLSDIRRVLVALDASRHSLAALEAAAELAARMEAELLGLFVEDINLLKLAELPFAREVTYPSATDQRLDSIRMERELRVQAEQARRALATAAKRARVHWSFRVVRGQVPLEVLEAALGADLLSLGKASRQLTKRVRLGSTAREVVTRGSRYVLLTQHGVRIGQPVLVVYDGSESSKQALNAAGYLAEAEEGHLTVFILAVDLITAQRLEKEVAEWLRGRKLQIHYHQLAGLDVQSLVRAVRMEEGGVLVLHGENSMLPSEAMQTLLEEIDCPVLLVR